MIRTSGTILLLSLLFFLPSASVGETTRPEKLQSALADPAAVRSVFFVEGMTCRACTLLIDRHLNKLEGLYWARFNYPIRIFVAYYRPKEVSVELLKKTIESPGELRMVLLESRPAGEGAVRDGDPVAVWKGGSLTLEEAREAPLPFRKMLSDFALEEGTEEWRQVAYEIAGETMRSGIFRRLAEEQGFREEGAAVDLPVMISKDFYWPVDLLPSTPSESAVARFVREKVILGDEGEEGRKRFDQWLLALWKELSLDFRGEALELNP